MEPNSPTGDAELDTREELDRLRDRLSFYESFDQLIQENITRAGDLLREAAARKSESELALRNNNAEVAKQQLAERVAYRKVFSSLLDEVTTVQQNVERLARQVADALDDLEAVIPAQGELASLENGDFPSMPTFSSKVAGELNAGSPSAGYDEEGAAGLIADPADVQLGEPGESIDLEPVDELVTVDEAVSDTTDFGTAPVVSTYGSPGFQEVVQLSVDRVSGALSPNEADDADVDDAGGISVDISAEDGSWNVESIEPIAHDAGESGVGDGGYSPEPEIDLDSTDASHDEASTSEFGEDSDLSGSGSIEDSAEAAGDTDESDEDDADEWAGSGGEAATTLLVHGVPRATTALSLKRYLEGLEQVHAVEPREYAEGVLRLQVSSDRPVGIDDLRAWPDAAGLEPVEIRDDFLEVRLGQ